MIYVKKEELLSFIKDKKTITQKELITYFKVSSSKISLLLKDLIIDNCITKTKNGRGNIIKIK